MCSTKHFSNRPSNPPNQQLEDDGDENRYTYCPAPAYTINGITGSEISCAHQKENAGDNYGLDSITQPTPKENIYIEELISKNRIGEQRCIYQVTELVNGVPLPPGKHI